MKGKLIMSKSFKLTAYETREGTMVETENEGYNAIEILGLLEAKKRDIIEQIYNPDRFKRINVSDGTEIEVRENS
jgi:hypothetical protein